MTNIIIGGNAVTMTSLELVDFMNERREKEAEREGKVFPSDEHPQLTHANFLAKVPKVLGETSHSFECDLPDSYGRSRAGYRFPKREACLMAMSYSYDIQAKVFDRMTAMEQALLGKPKAKPSGVLPGPAREFRAAHGIAKLIGLKGNQATLAANKATTRITGVNFLETLGAEKLDASDQDPHMTVTEIGARLGMAAAAINNLLINEGYQTRIRTGGKKGRYRYTPTESGQRYAVLVDMDKAQGAGKPVQGWEWRASILPRLALAARKGDAA